MHCAYTACALRVHCTGLTQDGQGAQGGQAEARVTYHRAWAEWSPHSRTVPGRLRRSRLRHVPRASLLSRRGGTTHLWV
eukprot:scaffold101908_cov59-Phaeocystis_antarctica.AAC.1